MKLHHLAVKVRDLTRAERFYVDTLQLTIERRWNDDAGKPRSFWCALDDGGFLAVELAADHTAAKADTAVGWHCLAFAIEPTAHAAMRERLISTGYPVIGATAFTFYVRDPDGNLVGFSSYPQKSV